MQTAKRQAPCAFLFLLLRIYFISNSVYVCLSVYGYVNMIFKITLKARGIRSPGTGIIGNFKLPDVGAGN